jgi:hypothetical protein
MRYLGLFLMLVLVAGCSADPPPTLGPAAGPDTPAAPSANVPYRPVLAGTAYHGIGSRP